MQKKKPKAWINGKPKQWAKEGSGNFDDETQSLDRRWNPWNPEKPRLVGVGWALRWRTGRRRGSEVWIGGLGLGLAWFDRRKRSGSNRRKRSGSDRWLGTAGGLVATMLRMSRANGGESETERWEFERVSLREIREMRNPSSDEVRIWI